MSFPLTDADHAHIQAMIDAQPEIIVAAAIRWENGVVVLVERPGRHGNCINLMHWKGIDYADQGFVTNHGRFVDRIEAAEIARASGQGDKREGVNGLFSEDLWND